MSHILIGALKLGTTEKEVARDKIVAAFRDGRFSLLVATDVAAPGPDIPNVDLVTHYEIPNSSEIFFHRSGRTGQAGRKDTAILMYTRAQCRVVSPIKRDIGCKFEEVFASKSSLIAWCQSIGRENDIVLIITKSEPADSRCKGELHLGCERGVRMKKNQKQKLEVDRSTSSKKCGWPLCWEGCHKVTIVGSCK